MVRGQRPVRGRRPPRKPLVGRRPAVGRSLQEGEGLSGGQRPSAGRSPAGDERSNLGRRPTVQLHSTGTAAFSKHTRLHPYVLLDTASLSHSFHILLSLYPCVCLCLSLSSGGSRILCLGG